VVQNEHNAVVAHDLHQGPFPLHVSGAYRYRIGAWQPYSLYFVIPDGAGRTSSKPAMDPGSLPGSLPDVTVDPSQVRMLPCTAALLLPHTVAVLMIDDVYWHCNLKTLVAM
jgi:hypothetical protein